MMTTLSTRGTVIRLLALALFVVAISFVITVRVHADPPPTLDVTVASSTAGASDGIDIATMKYADAVAALTANAKDPGSATLGIAPTGFPGVTLNDASLLVGASSQHSIAIKGTATFLSLSTTVLVTATWESADDTAPDTALLFSFGTASLKDFTSFSTFPVSLTKSWIGVTQSEHTVDVSALPADAATFFDDGNADTDDSIDLGAGVTFRGLVDTSSTVIGDAVTEVGLSDQVRLDGTLTTSVGSFNGDATAGLSLSATLASTGKGSLPGWFSPTGDWTLSFAADSGGSVSAGISGSADITIGSKTVSVTAGLGFEYADGAATFDFSADIDKIDNLFGQEWLDLASAELDASYSTADGFEGGISATVDLNDLTGKDATATATINFAAGSDGASGSIALSSDISAGMSDIATALGATLPSGFDLDFDGFTLYAGFETADSKTELTLAFETSLSLTINSAKLDSDILLRGTMGGDDGSKFLFAAKPAADAPSSTLGDLLDADLGDADITLPGFTITISNNDWDIAADDLDPATQAYLGDGEDLDVGKGVVITSDITLPAAVTKALGQVGIDTSGSLVLTGKLPLFGGTETSIAIALPTIEGDAAPFKSGTLSLKFEKVDGDFKLELEGDVTIEVLKAEKAGCTSTSTDEDCFDDLDFNVTAALEFGTSGVGFSLTGGLAVDGGWSEPFGVDGLTIYNLVLKVGVTAEPPAVTIGMRGNLKFGDTNVDVSFLLAVSPEPPWVEPLGFTFASNGFKLLDLVDLHELVSDTGDSEASFLDDLPSNLNLQNVFVAYGIKTDTDLCIRQGFYLAGELHMGGTIPTGDVSTDCKAPPVSPPKATQSCQDDSTCLASVLINIDTGQGAGIPSINAAGYIAETDLGPLHFDPTILQLTLSSTTQRLYLAGGASLDDPFDTSSDPDTWASGNFVLDFSSKALSFTAELDLADGKALHVKATGVGVLSLTDPKFKVDVQFYSDLLDNLVDEVGPAINKFVADVDNFPARLTEARSDDVNVFRNLLTYYQQNDIDAPDWLVTALSTLATVQDTVNNINGVFEDAGLPGPIVPDDIIDIVLHGKKIPAFGGIPGVVFPGGCFFSLCWDDTCVVTWVDGDCYSVPPVDFPPIPGLCDDADFGGDFHDILCTNLSEEDVVGRLFKNRLKADGITPPDGKSGVDILDALKPKFTGSGVDGNCGFVSFDYANHTGTDTELTLIVHGAPVVIDVPLDIINGATNGFDSQDSILQAVFDALMGSGGSTASNCTTGSKPLSPPNASITLTADPTTLDEGGSVTVSGTAAVTGATSVTIDWGDGTATSTASLDDDGKFTAKHTYADDSGVGTSTSYNIDASFGTAIGTTRVTVRNVAPKVTAAFNPATINEGANASLDVTITDPGTADTHTLTATWSDGTVQHSGTIAAGTLKYTFTRLIADDNPTATASDTLTASVAVTDKDGGTGATTDDATLTVKNVAPTNVRMTPDKVLAGEPSYDGDGNLIATEGALVLWDVSFDDVGLNDSATVTIDWQDGSDPISVRVGPNGKLTRTVQVQHYYADDNPTATSSDTYNVKVTVTDDDTGKFSGDVPITIHDVKPTISSVVADTTTPKEMQEDALTIDWTDPGGHDTFTVKVDWADGHVDTIPVALPDPLSTSHSIVAKHTYADDDPTNTSHDTYKVKVTVTDDDTLSDSSTIDLDVHNVAPTITSYTLSASEQDENASSVTLDLAFSDPSLVDSHTVTVDWGDGWTAGDSNDTTVDDEDAKTTIIHVAAPGAAATPDEVTAARKVSATNRYGDNGTYTISVTVTDDDTGQVSDSHQLVIDNVAPTHSINDGPDNGAFATSGGPAFITQAGQDVTMTDTASDPGSDDLTFTWDFGDGDGTTHQSLVGVPAAGVADPAISPQVSPRLVTDSVVHSYSGACLYTVTTGVVDDDGGDGGVATSHVVITAPLGAAPQRLSYWQDQVDNAIGSRRHRPRNVDQVECYLAIAHYLSPQLGPTLTLADARDILDPSLRRLGSTARAEALLRRDLLQSLLNFANGAWAWTDTARNNSATYESLVAAANHALDSGSMSELDAVLKGLPNLPTTTIASATFYNYSSGPSAAITASTIALGPTIVEPGGNDDPGSISFWNGSTLLCTVAVDPDGTAECTAGVLPASAAPHSLTATYNKDYGFLSSTSTTDVVQHLARPTLTQVTSLATHGVSAWLVGGGGFSGARSVSACGSSVPFTVVNDNIILVAFPTVYGPKQCTITVTASGGTGSSAPVTVGPSVPITPYLPGW